MKKQIITMLLLIIFISSFSQYTIATTNPGEIYEDTLSITYRNTTVYAPAVAQLENGDLIGVISTITVTIQSNGTGRVFVDTLPLTEIDMQGSARLAVKVASKIVEVDDISAENYDYFFVVRTDAPIIGGPSAGGIMTVATIALLEGWEMTNTTVMTGMINPDGSIGPIGGIPQKIDAAYSVGATRFLIPKGQSTYTERVTETVEKPWGTQIVTRDAKRNVSDYAMDNYGIEVVEVEDIKEAVANFTGYTFETKVSDKQISTEDYVDSMIPLASTLLNNSRELYKNASEFFENSSIPNRWPNYYKNDVTDLLNDAKDRFEESQRWYDEGLYYSSTSKSFQSLIDSRFVIYACEYFNTAENNRDQYITYLLDEAISLHENKSLEAENAEINGMITLQCVGAAQKRVTEASSYLSDAKSSYNNGNYITMLYEISFAVERSNSVGWWLGISDGFEDSGDMNITTLETIIDDYMNDAQQSITYSYVILQQSGIYSSSYITSAQELLESAEDNLENDYQAAALFETLEALVKANLAIENIDDDAEAKISRSRNSSSNSISESRNIGIEPVLAVSYYEYAESLVNESMYDSALIYYKYSNIIAGAMGFTSFSSTTTSSRYIGIPEIKNPVELKIYRISDMIVFGLFAFIIGGVGGILIGLIVSSGSKQEKPKKQITQQKWTPRNINDYYKKQKDNYYPNGQIPRSMKDYYKKNK